MTDIIFAIGLGMTGDATVSSTAGVLQKLFNLKWTATLIGVLFLGHQVGAFISIYPMQFTNSNSFSANLASLFTAFDQDR